jgi:hypothetical protein
MKTKKAKRPPFQWIIDAFEGQPSFVQKAMFGCHGCYLQGRLVLVLAGREEPWKGILIPTERAYHSSLCKDFAVLRIHSVLKKWLYLSESTDGFEETALAFVQRILEKDPRNSSQTSYATMRSVSLSYHTRHRVKY